MSATTSFQLSEWGEVSGKRRVRVVGGQGKDVEARRVAGVDVPRDPGEPAVRVEQAE